MNLFGHRQKIIDDVRAAVPKTLVKSVRGHRGRFSSIKELRSVALKAVTVLVASRPFSKGRKTPQGIKADVPWDLWVVVGGGKDDSRDELAAEIGELLLSLVTQYSGSWGNDENIRGGNVTTLAIEQNGVAIWVLSWETEMTLDALDESALRAWEAWHADHVNEDDEIMMQTSVEHTQ